MNPSLQCMHLYRNPCRAAKGTNRASSWNFDDPDAICDPSNDEFQICDPDLLSGGSGTSFGDAVPNSPVHATSALRVHALHQGREAGIATGGEKSWRDAAEKGRDTCDSRQGHTTLESDKSYADAVRNSPDMNTANALWAEALEEEVASPDDRALVVD